MPPALRKAIAMPTGWSRTAAAVGFLVASVVGVLTNIITRSFSWTLGGALATLIVIGMITAALQVSGPFHPKRTRVNQKVAAKARLQDTQHELSGDATMDERILGRGRVERSGIRATTGHVARRIRGRVKDSGITIRK